MTLYTVKLFQNGMLERICALKRKDIIGGEKSILTLMKYTIYEITLRTPN